jgi:hypothetical protein
MVRLLSGHVPLYIVNEYPKSGGTWVGLMLAEALNIPFPRNCMPKLEPSIMHGHFLNPFGMKNVLCVWRDGRDVMVSWYYHCLFVNEHSNAFLVELTRRDICFEDYDDILGNLPQFIDYVFQQQKSPSFSWVDFVCMWHNRNGVVNVHYEDLKAEAGKELQRIAYELSGNEFTLEKSREIAEVFSFEKIAGRQCGEEKKNGFMRKGIVGDWKNHFSKESRQLFDSYAGDELIKLGYEVNHDWVE